MRLNELYNTYKDQVEFRLIYIREAHPDDGWRAPANLRDGIFYNEPTSDDERTEVAAVCQIKLDLAMPMLVDGIGNDVEGKYVSVPMRLYLVDRDGKIAYTGDLGPHGFNTETWEEVIKQQLVDA